jgi:glutathione S-transferase
MAILLTSMIALGTRSSVRAFSLPISTALTSSLRSTSGIVLHGMNPLQSLFQNIRKQGMSSLSSAKLSELASATSSLPTASWEEIRSILESKQTSEERQFRNNLPRGVGVGSPLHRLRLFEEGNREEDVRVTLFRDSASWCPYCQKVS